VLAKLKVLFFPYDSVIPYLNLNTSLFCRLAVLLLNLTAGSYVRFSAETRELRFLFTFGSADRWCRKINFWPGNYRTPLRTNSI